MNNTDLISDSVNSYLSVYGNNKSNILVHNKFKSIIPTKNYTDDVSLSVSTVRKLVPPLPTILDNEIIHQDVVLVSSIKF